MIQTSGFIFFWKLVWLHVEEIMPLPGVVIILLPYGITFRDLLQPVCAQTLDVFASFLEVERLSERIAESYICEPSFGLTGNLYKQCEMIEINAQISLRSKTRALR